MEQVKKLFSSKICNLRKQQNLTQEQMSERLSTTTRCFQKWEGGVSFPDFMHILFLVYFLKFDVYSFAEEVFINDLLPAAKRYSFKTKHR